MAIFGQLDIVKQQVKGSKFEVAFEYLEEIFKEGTTPNERLLSLAMNSFEKVALDANNFGLEQVYNTKSRTECFFESHRQYIDVQFILSGEEIIELCNINDLIVDSEYNKEMDLLKYNTTNNSSIIKLKKGDVAIFFPEDAHMPCVELNKSMKVFKTVVKVAV